MSLLTAAASQVGDVAGQQELRSTAGLSDVLFQTADRVRINRRAALALSRRISEMVATAHSILEQGSSGTIIPGMNALRRFEGALQEAHDALSAISQHSYLSQAIHQQRDREAIGDVANRVDTAFKVLMMELRLHTGTMVEALTSQLDDLLRNRPDDIQGLTTPPNHATVPPKPQIHFGRSQELTAVVDAITDARSPGRVAILGGPGMGKTSLAVAALHHPATEARFKESRHFVACDAAEAGSSAFRLLAEAFGVAPADQKGAEKSLRDALEHKGCLSLLVLDNFESAWEGETQRQNAEQLLQFLDSLDGLSLIITMRGTERPQGIPWCRPFLPPLSSLDDEAARETFLAISDVVDADRALDALLAKLDNVPLALVLMANLAQSEAPVTLLQRWEVTQTAMLVRGPGHTKATSLDVSIQLSMQSPRMQGVPAAQTLISVLSILPCGAVDTDISLWSMEDTARALSVLLRTSLASRVDDRICVLAPIRSFLLKNYPTSVEAGHPVYTHFFNLAEIAEKSTGHSFDQAVFAAVVPELANIDSVIRHTLRDTSSVHEEAVRAAAQLCNIFSKTCIGPGLELLPLALEVARQENFLKLQAELLYRWASLAVEGRMAGDPVTLYRESRELSVRADDFDGIMIASIGLLRFLSPQECVSEGRRLFRLSEQRQHVQYMAQSCTEIGHALHRDGRLFEAIAEHELAITLLRGVTPEGKNSRFIGINQYQIAEYYRAVNDMGAAVSAYWAALATFQAVKYPQGINVVYTQLANTSLFQGRLKDTIDQASCALAVENLEGFRNNMRALLILAQAHALAGNHIAAVAALDRLGEFEPPDGHSSFEQCRILRTRGAMALYRGDLAEARAVLGTGRAISRRRDAIESPEYMLAAEASIMVYLGEVEAASGNAAESCTLGICAALLFRSMSRNADTPDSLVLLADVVDDGLAERLLDAVMLPLLRMGARSGLANALVRSATIAEHQGNPKLAARRAQNAIAYFGDIKDRHRMRAEGYILANNDGE